MDNAKIFFSYAWDDEGTTAGNEKIVTDLFEVLRDEGYYVIRDKENLSYRGFISDFMTEIGKGDFIVIALSKKYVHSYYCMTELYEIAKRSEFDKHKFQQKVLPVFVEPIDLSSSSVRAELLDYWKNKLDDIKAHVEEQIPEVSREFFDKYSRVKEIYQNIDQILGWLSDMNIMNAAKLLKENFLTIKTAIASKIVSDNPPLDGCNIPTATSYRISNVSKLLLEGFSDGELNLICMEHFPSVFNVFADMMGKDNKIFRLLDYCRTRLEFPKLLSILCRLNKAQFDMHKPYY